QVTADIDRNVLSIKTLADDSSQGSQHAVHGIIQLVRQLSELDRLVRQFQQQPAPRQLSEQLANGRVVLAR
ncbi:TPA: chemotaxis protein, partial [Aeromonas hydrophila]|nr:chemotaxis protein [Aeromonas hydrophila]